MAPLSKDDTARLRGTGGSGRDHRHREPLRRRVRRGDAASISACFADDATLDHGHGQSVEGIDAIRQYFGAVKDSAASKAVMNFDEKVASTPVMSNVLIELDGDTAHCESMCLAIHAGFRDGEGSVIVRGTRNIDDLVRTPEGWKIRKRLHPPSGPSRFPAPR